MQHEVYSASYVGDVVTEPQRALFASDASEITGIEARHVLQDILHVVLGDLRK